MDPSSPKTPTARKAPATTTPSKSRSHKASSAGGQKSRAKVKAADSDYFPASGKKRKTKSEMSSTKNVTPKGKSAGARGQAVPKTPVKKQKVECHEERTELTDKATVSFPSLESQPSIQFPTPSHSPKMLPRPFLDLSSYGPPPQHELQYYMPQAPQQQQQLPLNDFLHRQQKPMLPHMFPHQQEMPLELPFQQQPTPINPRQQQQSASSPAVILGKDRSMDDCNKELLVFDQLIVQSLQQHSILDEPRLTSTHIDKIAYIIYENCIYLNLLNVAAKYAAMLSETKLRALAMLNLMATWWFLRERLVRLLSKMHSNIDDSIMQTGIEEAAVIASHTMEMVKGKGDSDAVKKVHSMECEDFQQEVIE